jgi:hypothetical protein
MKLTSNSAPMSEQDRALLEFKLERVHSAKRISAILGVVVPVGFCAFVSLTPTDFTQVSVLAGVAFLCLFFATPFAAFWIDKRRAIVRIEGWLDAGKVALMRGTVTSKGANYAITIGETPMRVWHRIHQLPVGHEATVEFLPTNGQPLLHGVLRVNGEDNPYFANAVAVGPPGP